jgi:hypothetical protein
MPYGWACQGGSNRLPGQMADTDGQGPELAGQVTGRRRRPARRIQQAPQRDRRSSTRRGRTPGWRFSGEPAGHLRSEPAGCGPGPSAGIAWPAGGLFGLQHRAAARMAPIRPHGPVVIWRVATTFRYGGPVQHGRPGAASATSGPGGPNTLAVLTFDHADVHEIDSSREVLRLLAIGVVRLLGLPSERQPAGPRRLARICSAAIPKTTGNRRRRRPPDSGGNGRQPAGRPLTVTCGR